MGAIARSPPEADDEAISKYLVSLKARLLRSARNDEAERFFATAEAAEKPGRDSGWVCHSRGSGNPAFVGSDVF